jgi:hypothetical protein
VSEAVGRALPILSTATLWNKLPLIARKSTIPRSWAWVKVSWSQRRGVC